MRDVILLEPVEEGLRLQAFFEEPVTVQARVERQNANAMAVATFLQKHPRVRQVFYPGLESHPPPRSGGPTDAGVWWCTRLRD